MDFQHLREFLTIAKELNLTVSARKLCTTQSTLSKHLSSLEKEVGAKLVERTSRSLALTPAGIEFAKSARQACEVIDDCLSLITELAVRSHVKISGMLNNGDIIAIFTLALQLLKTQGNKNLSITPSITLPFIKRVIEGDVDMAICYGVMNERPDEGICRVPLLQERFVAYMHPECPLSSMHRLSIDDLRDVTLVRLVGDYAQGGWETIAAVCQAHGFDPKYRTHPANDPVDFLMTPLDDTVLILQDNALSTSPFSTTGFSEAEVVDDDAFFTMCLYYREDDEEELADYIEAICLAAENFQQDMGKQHNSSSWIRLEHGWKTVSEQAALNESEAAAFKEFLMGHSLEHIGETLGVSRLLAGDLVVAVYRKLGINSRQEMLDLVESHG